MQWIIAAEQQAARDRAAKARKKQNGFGILLALENVGAGLATIADVPLQAIPGVNALADIGVGSLDATVAEEDAAAFASAMDSEATEDSAADDEALTCANSFAAATPVTLANGTSTPINHIKLGDTIANATPGELPGTQDQHHTVTAIHITHTDHDYTDVTITTPHGPATITGTAHHLYWDATTHHWTPANQLHPGDQLQTTNATTTPILTIHNHTATMVTNNLTLTTSTPTTSKPETHRYWFTIPVQRDAAFPIHRLDVDRRVERLLRTSTNKLL